MYSDPIELRNIPSDLFFNFKFMMMDDRRAAELCQKLQRIHGVSSVRRISAPSHGKTDMYQVTLPAAEAGRFSAIHLEVVRSAFAFQTALFS